MPCLTPKAFAALMLFPEIAIIPIVITFWEEARSPELFTLLTF